MKNLNQLLSVTAVGAAVVKARLMQRFIGNLASVITLAIATGFMAGALLIGGFYLVYQELIRYGLESLPAEILTAVMAIVTTGILIGATASRIGRLKGIPGQIIHTEFPLASRLNGIADSFLNGLLDA